ncbi:MAG TPA: GNAT family N-acetyltransferase [Acidimicrobiia bacterium]|nr:GNAT family N-acetyltransferase [Acidimicrobiia bacterium]
MDHRPLTLADAQEVTGLINRFERFWNLPLVTPVAQVEHDFTEPHVDLDLDTRGYWLGDDLVGYGLIWHRPSGERQERAYLQGVVNPDFRGQGVGRQLLGWEIERARDSLSTCEPSIPWYIGVAEWEGVEDAHRLYRRFGMKPVRYIKEMLRPLDAPVGVDIPDGIELIPWDRSLDEAARIAQNEAFADHWGSTPTDPESYQHRLERQGTRLNLSFMARAGDEVVGICLNGIYPDDETATGRREGWIESLGVKRAWRGKGVASAMVRASINVFLDEGMTHSSIGVDADNPTGAFGLYQSLGFEVLHGTIISELEVATGATLL